MNNEIPAADLAVIDARDLGRCVRCGGQANDHHHRRRRREHDTHTHQGCNVISLCRVCHAWVHANARLSLETGHRLKPWVTDPHRQPVNHYLYGWVWLNCDGTIVLLGECEECETITLLEGGLCMACLRREVCCDSASQAAASMCGCGGVAARQLAELIEREKAVS